MKQCDVLVVGSGAAGLTAALAAAKHGLKVVVVEKERYYGGTTAISAGWAWVPGNRQGVELGDTRTAVEDYLRQIAPAHFDAEGVEAFLDTVPEAISFLEDEAGVQFIYPPKAPDYQMDKTGAKESGRAIIPTDVDARILGPDRLKVQPYLSSYTVFGYMPQVGADITHFFRVNQSLRSFVYVASRLLRTWWDTLWFRRSLTRSNGNALITQMLKAAKDAGVDLRTSAPVERLITDDSGRVVSAEIGGDHPGAITARLGVVIATGGFSGNDRLRREYFPHDKRGDNHFTPTLGHGGDGAELALTVGGTIDSTVESVGSWAPVTVFRYLDGRQRLFPHLRAFGLPGLIGVDRHGQRFAGEASSYHDYGSAMIANDAAEKDTWAWIVGDATAMHKYGIGYAKPWPMPRSYFFKTGYLRKANTLEELAQKIDVDPAGLVATVAAFNEGATRGEDPAFGRGSTKYHHFKGDPLHKPNPNLAPLNKPPYYATKIQMGDLGTFAGIAVDSSSRVTTGSGDAIPGLYAVGAAAVSVFGGGYPGYGSHIGPALVFGYRVGRNIATEAKRPEAPES
ncbi:FAD-dependent oxidoreductase [Microbacterium sp. KRD172]|uniref:FAD-dependent oxidoreductase n=1 Tax=Microbacterium sp. KRD172 TaxID=2729727 RepID=UPI0027DC6425|nr:FAD-dependent oxidoreductase [Microbacterium sp. KRD172]